MLDRRAMLTVTGCSALLYPYGAAAFTASPLSNALEAIRDFKLIAIGERHDNPDHHKLQAELVRLLQPSGLAFEMIPREHEAMVNEMRREGASRDELGKALNWAETGWLDWDLYAPILEAAPDAYVAGGGLSRKTLTAIYRDGPIALGEAFVQRYGLETKLPSAAMTDMLDAQFQGHCGMIARDKLAPMVTIQRVWDASYADALLRAAQKGGGSAVLICGNAHARLDYGAPSYVKHSTGEIAASIGLLEEGEPDVESGKFTTTLTASAPVRDDPCDALRGHEITK